MSFILVVVAVCAAVIFSLLSWFMVEGGNDGAPPYSKKLSQESISYNDPDKIVHSLYPGFFLDGIIATVTLPMVKKEKLHRTKITCFTCTR